MQVAEDMLHVSALGNVSYFEGLWIMFFEELFEDACCLSFACVTASCKYADLKVLVKPCRQAFGIPLGHVFADRHKDIVSMHLGKC